MTLDLSDPKSIRAWVAVWPERHLAMLRSIWRRRPECREAIEEGARKRVFVFGSNLAGRHGKGAALFAAQHHGAVRGQGVGMQGNSYAIPTKDADLAPLPLGAIKGRVADFLEFARAHPELRFEVTAIGCGLAGYSPAQIAPMFVGASDNCDLPDEFLKEPK